MGGGAWDHSALVRALGVHRPLQGGDAEAESHRLQQPPQLADPVDGHEDASAALLQPLALALHEPFAKVAAGAQQHFEVGAHQRLQLARRAAGIELEIIDLRELARDTTMEWVPLAIKADIDLGMIAKSAIIDPAIADAAFSLPSGEVSQPVQGRFGVALVKIGKIVPGSPARCTKCTMCSTSGSATC